MSTYEYIQITLVLVVFVACSFAGKLFHFLKSKRRNRELWGTIFEGATHKLINLDAIKEPEMCIEKKSKQSGQSDDEDKNLQEENNK